MKEVKVKEETLYALKRRELNEIRVRISCIQLQLETALKSLDKGDVKGARSCVFVANGSVRRLAKDVES